jgi:hypothetical protein
MSNAYQIEQYMIVNNRSKPYSATLNACCQQSIKTVVEADIDAAAAAAAAAAAMLDMLYARVIQ